MLQMIISALLPIMVTLLLGFFAGRHHDFSQDQAAILNRMVMLYALPLLLFSGILTTPLSNVTANMTIFFWIAIGMAGSFIFVFLISHFIFRSDVKLASLRALAIGGPAVPFVGIPVLGVLFPAEADLAVAAGSLVMNLVQVPLALLFLIAGSNESQSKRSPLAIITNSIINSLKQPVVWAPVLAFLMLIAGLNIPQDLKGSFTLLGQATGGVALFAVGIILYSQKISLSIPVSLNVFSKNIALPSIILLAMMFFKISEQHIGLVVVTLAIPTASLAVIFAVEYKSGEKEMASTLFWSTILSIFTMGGFIWITS